MKVNWLSVDDNPPQGAGGQVWTAYRNPAHPDGWNVRVEWTPLRLIQGPPIPEFWAPLEPPENVPPLATYESKRYVVHLDGKVVKDFDTQQEAEDFVIKLITEK